MDILWIMEFKPTNKEQPDYLDLENGTQNAGASGDVNLLNNNWSPDLASELPPEVRAAFIKKIYCFWENTFIFNYIHIYNCNIRLCISINIFKKFF